MVKSMTGFGRNEYSDEKRNITVEIKSVNHRYCDINVRMPRRYSFAEEKVKSVVKQVARRGKIEVSIMVENIGDSDLNISLNTAIAKQYMDNLALLKETLGLADDIRLEYIASLPDVMKAIPDVEDEEEITRILCEAVAGAVDRHNEMRCIEGEKLAADILMRADLISENVNEIEKRAPQIIMEYRDKFKKRMAELLEGNLEVAEERILVEAALHADKINITEEIVRLRSHISQLKKIIAESSQPDGKKLDFLIQEFNREANTIASKSNDTDTTNYALNVKSEIEKIREQVQNIE